MNDHDGEWEGGKELSAWQRSHSQHPRRSLRGYPFEQEEAFLEAEQDDLRQTSSMGLKSATAVSVSTSGGS